MINDPDRVITAKPVTDAPANGFQNQFIKLALKRLPHHTALYVAAKLHCLYLVNILNSYARKHIVGKVSLRHSSAAELRQYESTTRETTLWHGTGRYQHHDGQIVDVLENIVTTGAIRPIEDAYAIFSGGELMNSISLTRLRIIARCYADMHGKGYLEANRYGDALTWTSYHYGLFYARLYTVHYPKIRRHYKTWHALTHDGSGHNIWGKKSNRSAQDVWDVFGLGSDIPDNYPIIFGVREIKDTVQLSSVFRDYEVRTQRSIKLQDITHVEVPHSKVESVRRLFAKHEVTIIVEPIELGEWAASHKPFSNLLGFDH